MTELTLFSLVQMALLAGMLHSLDADHIAAVSAMMDGKSQTRWPLFSLHWALGHGAALIIVAIAVLLLGMAIPHRMSELAEAAVGVTLVVIGVLAWYHLYREYQGGEAHSFVNGKATTVGIIHGSAGSAPLLAILPVTAIQSPFWGVSYVVLFSLGVLSVMLLLGRALTLSMVTLHRHMTLMATLLRPLLATFSVGLGAYLLFP